jgi:hypothetical protein
MRRCKSLYDVAFAAGGWQLNRSDEKILERLLALDLESGEA